MNVALHRPWTMARFLALAETQARRFEFDGTRPVAMKGGAATHAIIRPTCYSI
jgi:hypothetical protein